MTNRIKEKFNKAEEKNVIDGEFKEVKPEEQNNDEQQEEPKTEEKKDNIFVRFGKKAKQAGKKVVDTGKKMLSNKWVKRGFMVVGTVVGVGGAVYLVLRNKNGEKVIVKADDQDVAVSEQAIATEQAGGSYEEVHGYVPEVEDPVVETVEVEETKPINEWTAEDLEHSERDCTE